MTSNMFWSARQWFVDHDYVNALMFQPPTRTAGDINWLYQNAQIEYGPPDISDRKDTTKQERDDVFRSLDHPYLIVHPTSRSRTDAGGALDIKTVRRVIVYFHGNGEDLVSLCATERVNELAEKYQAIVICPEYPGYSIRPGRPCESSVHKAARQAVKFALRFISMKNTEQQLRFPIYLYGLSMGSAAAMEAAVAHSHAVSGVILRAPFTSLSAVTENIVGSWGNMLVAERFNNLEKLKDLPLDIPVTIMHGQKDTLIPVEQAEKLFRVRAHFCPQTTILCIDKDGSHGTFSTTLHHQALEALFSK